MAFHGQHPHGEPFARIRQLRRNLSMEKDLGTVHQSDHAALVRVPSYVGADEGFDLVAR